MRPHAPSRPSPGFLDDDDHADTVEDDGDDAQEQGHAVRTLPPEAPRNKRETEDREET